MSRSSAPCWSKPDGSCRLWAGPHRHLPRRPVFAFLPPFEAFQALFFIWCVEALADRIPVKPSTLAVIGGALGSAALLGKVNIGLFAVSDAGEALKAVIIEHAVVAPGRRSPRRDRRQQSRPVAGDRPAPGQGMGAYATGVYQIIAGYNAAMGVDPTPDRTSIFCALAAIVAIVVWSGWQSSRSWPSRRRIGLAALGLGCSASRCGRPPWSGSTWSSSPRPPSWRCSRSPGDRSADVARGRARHRDRVRWRLGDRTAELCQRPRLGSFVRQ